MMKKINQDTERLFFGLSLNQHCQSHIHHWATNHISALKPPVHQHNLHLTLAFLAQVTPQQKADYHQFASQIINQKFTLTFTETGYWQKSGVFYLKPSHIPDELNQLATLLRNHSETIGTYHNPFAFHPHITLFRNVKSTPCVRQEMPPVEIEFDTFNLFHSCRINDVLTYQIIERYHLLSHKAS